MLLLIFNPMNPVNPVKKVSILSFCLTPAALTGKGSHPEWMENWLTASPSDRPPSPFPRWEASHVPRQPENPHPKSWLPHFLWLSPWLAPRNVPVDQQGHLAPKKHWPFPGHK